MDSLVIEAEDALALLEQEVQTEGDDFVYTPIPLSAGAGIHELCKYVDRDGTPSCLAGRALFSAGVPIDTLELLDVVGEIRDPECVDILKNVGFELTPGAVLVLSTAQTFQDVKKPWGTALAEAKDRANHPEEWLNDHTEEN